MIRMLKEPTLCGPKPQATRFRVTSGFALLSSVAAVVSWLLSQHLPSHDLGRTKVCSWRIELSDIAGVGVGGGSYVARWRMLSLLLLLLTAITKSTDT